MTEIFQEQERVDYVEVDEDLCNGCVLCMKACPTKAIRIRNNRASIEGVCIGCVECVRVCPRGAMRTAAVEDFDLDEKSNYVVSPSTVLYAQFGSDYLPNDILLGLRRIGFGYVHDQSYTSEIFSYATDLHIRELRKKPDASFPLISPCCPVVSRLIAYRFPNLLSRISPLATPREIVAREAKKRFSAKTGSSPKDINVLHITPCPAMSVQVMQAAASEKAKDRAIGINHIYETLEKHIKDIEDDRVLHYSGGVGLGWGLSGGEIASIDARCLGISGLHETIRYLEKIEMGLLDDMDYIEFRVCPEGCIGGPFTVADKYKTKRLVQKLVRMFGVERRVKSNYVKNLYRQGWFSSESSPAVLQVSSLDISKGIERQGRVEEVMKLLPSKECGACGSPDCRTFAEDVVDGRTGIEMCHQLPDKNEIGFFEDGD